MMKNFVKLLVIAMAPVVLTSGVWASKEEGLSLKELQVELNSTNDAYYLNKWTAAETILAAAKKLEEKLASVANAKKITEEDLTDLETLFTDLQGAAMPLFTKERLWGASATEQTLKSNIAAYWKKLSPMDLLTKTAQFNVGITYKTATWDSEPGVIEARAYPIVVPENDTSGKAVEAKKYADLISLFEVIRNANYKEAFSEEPQMPKYIQDLFDRLKEIKFVESLEKIIDLKSIEMVEAKKLFEEIIKDRKIWQDKISKIMALETGAALDKFAIALKKIA